MLYRSNKLRFNTETGVLLISRKTLRHPYKDSELYFEADFLKTRSGEYFLYGCGGLLSFFRGQKEDKILPLTKEEAKAIAREFMRPPAYQEEFLR